MLEALKELQDMQKEIENANRKMDTLNGRKEEVLNRIKEEFKINSLEEAEQFIQQETVALQTQESILLSEYNLIKDKFVWI